MYDVRRGWRRGAVAGAWRADDAVGLFEDTVKHTRALGEGSRGL